MRNAEAAILKIEELQSFLQNIQHNPTTNEDIKKQLKKHYRTLNQDIVILRDRIATEPFPKDVNCKELTEHFEALHSTLVEYSQKIHFDK